jgi:hypothetical protein
MTYQPKIYRAQGGASLVVSSGGAITVAGSVAVSSGGYISSEIVQTAATSATVINAYGLTIVTGTTVGPTFLISNPITGVPKYINLAASSSGATHRAIIAPASTGVSFDTTGENNITLATSAIRGVTLVGASTTAWKCVGTYVNTMLGLGNVAT